MKTVEFSVITFEFHFIVITWEISNDLIVSISFHYNFKIILKMQLDSMESCALNYSFSFFLLGAPVPPLTLVGGEAVLLAGDSAPSPSLSPTEGKSETSDEWMDVSDTETDISIGAPISITTQIPL